jgi:hypothetical protein
MSCLNLKLRTIRIESSKEGMWNSMPTMPLRPFLEEIVQSIYGVNDL